MHDIEEDRGHSWARMLARLAARRPWVILVVVGIVTVGAGVRSSRLEMRMNWADLLPDGNPAVEGYREIQTRFGDASGIVVALEGERDSIVAMAEELAPRLEALESLRTVMGRAPTAHMRNHGAVLLKPTDLDRMLRRSADWTLVGSLRGLNDDLEREYTDSETNLRRDEVDVSRSVLGMTRSLELLSAGLSGTTPPSAMNEAADAWVLGEPWLLSLDRRMLLISCMPEADWTDIRGQITAVEDVEAAVADVGQRYPTVEAGTTGMSRIAKDEMESVGFYTVILSILALVLIFVLLSRTFRGWVVPVLALTPLVVGIMWTMGAIQLLFGSINLFTSMMSLVLLGLGIDFAIHLTARFQEERSRGGSLERILARTLSTTGVAVTVGAVTTALAFFTLLVGRTVGFDEFGAAAGSGVLLTLAAIFLTQPPLLVLRERWRIRRGHPRAGVMNGVGGIQFPTRPADGGDPDDRGRGLAATGYSWIGRVAAAAWQRPLPFLAGAAVVAAVGVWGALHTEWEWDFLELEAAGLRSVSLQREIPRRFGTSDHAAWVVASSLAESRALKESFRELPVVGEVAALSDLVPPPERVAAYGPRLEAFRAGALARDRPAWTPGDGPALAVELDRLWDNLDLMSNLAFTAGLDRIVAVIDRLTGLDAATGQSEPSAVLPTLTRQVADLDAGMARPLAEAWAARMHVNLVAITNPAAVDMADVPEAQRRLYLARRGDGMLVQVFPRRYLGDRDALARFAAQTEEVEPRVVGTEKLILIMNQETLADGESAVFLALVVIAGLLMVYFRSPIGLLALIPLATGVVSMLGLMWLLGIKYNYMNMIAVPIILGIGIDDGVHALHRLREEAEPTRGAVLRSFRSVGKAILLTSVTTMIGFGSVMVYEMRGMASFGQVLFIGVATCFLATIFVLPAAVRLAARWGGLGRRAPSRTAQVGLFLAALLVATPARAQSPDGEDWLARIEAAETVPHATSLMTQTITTSGGSERTFTIRSWSAQDGDVALMAYVEPRRVAGDRILQLDGGDQFWYYMRRRDVTRHFTGHTRRQKAMGSDFSYEDLAWGDFTEDYTAELLGREALDGEETVKLRLVPTATGPSYHHLILWAGTEDRLTRQIEYYDEDQLLKTLFVSNFAVVEGRTIALRMEMVNPREGSRTVMETREITFSDPPDPGLFTRAALTRPLPQRRED